MPALRDSFMNKLISLAAENTNIVCLDCDVARHTRLKMFQDRYPDRFYQIGISEQNAIGVAAGLAKGGKIPIVSSFASFISGRAWEQIRHSIVYNDTNVKILATHSGLSASEDGATHQCIEDVSLMLSLPEIEVFSPAFEKECEDICQYIIKSKKPAYIRLGRDSINAKVNYTAPIGEPIIIGNSSCKCAIISTGEITNDYVEIIKQRTNIKLIHIGSIRPLDFEVIKKELNGVEKVVIAAELSQYNSFSSMLYENNIMKDKEVINLNMKGKFGQTGTINELRDFYKLSGQHVIDIMGGN